MRAPQAWLFVGKRCSKSGNSTSDICLIGLALASTRSFQLLDTPLICNNIWSYVNMRGTTFYNYVSFQLFKLHSINKEVVVFKVEHIKKYIFIKWMEDFYFWQTKNSLAKIVFFLWILHQIVWKTRLFVFAHMNSDYLCIPEMWDSNCQCPPPPLSHQLNLVEAGNPSVEFVKLIRSSTLDISCEITIVEITSPWHPKSRPKNINFHLNCTANLSSACTGRRA